MKFGLIKFTLYAKCAMFVPPSLLRQKLEPFSIADPFKHNNSNKNMYVLYIV